MKNFSDAINAARNAAKIAVDRSIKMTGGTTDPDLQMFDRLGPEDFDVLAKKYGAEATMNYIKAMEARRLKVKNG